MHYQTNDLRHTISVSIHGATYMYSRPSYGGWFIAVHPWKWGYRKWPTIPATSAMGTWGPITFGRVGKFA